MLVAEEQGRVQIRNREDCRWDVVSLGEVMLRFDPGEQRIAQARRFDVWEGGGEYNVARGLSTCFGARASVITALVRNPLGTLAEGLMRQGGVDTSHVRWADFDGSGITARNGLYFLERGFGLRGALGCMDRGHTAVAQMRAGEVDWDDLFGREGVRLFHTGGIFCGLSAGTPAVAREAMAAARRHGTVVSFDANYRPSLWAARGGRQAAAEANAELAPLIDILFGHAGDLALELGEAIDGPPRHTAASYAAMAERLLAAHPTLQLVATSTRVVRSANQNDFGAFAFADGTLHEAPALQAVEVLDRVGSGDAFAAGVLHGLLTGRDIPWALRCGVAHGALVMTTPGDNSWATLAEVEKLMAGGSAAVAR